MYLLDVPSDTDNMILQLHQKDRAIYGKYKIANGESMHCVYGSTVVDISILPPSSKLVSLSFSRSPLSKTPKQVFFNPINIFDSFTHSITVF